MQTHYLCIEAVGKEGKRTNRRGTEETLNGKGGLIKGKVWTVEKYFKGGTCPNMVD